MLKVRLFCKRERPKKKKKFKIQTDKQDLNILSGVVVCFCIKIHFPLPFVCVRVCFLKKESNFLIPLLEILSIELNVTHMIVNTK